MRSIISSLILLLLYCGANAYNTQNIYYGQLKNKATMVVLKDTSRSDLSLSMYIKVSPAVETKYNSGISRLLSYLILSNIIKLDSSYSKTTLEFFDEYTKFTFFVPNKEIEIERILSNIYRPILMDSGTLSMARNAALDSYVQNHAASPSVDAFEEKINTALWGEYTFKKAQNDANVTIPNISYKELRTYYDRYFKSFYSLFIVSGSFNAMDKFITINENTLYDESLNNTYIPISTLNIYSNLNTSSQYIFIDSLGVKKPKIELSFQLASNYQDKNGFVKATVLEALLNKYKQVLFDSIGITDFEISTVLYKNATTYNISYTPGDNEKEQYYQFLHILDNINFVHLINSAKLIDLLKSELNKYSVENKVFNSLEQNVVDNWSLNHIEDFFTYDKKIKDISISDLVDFYERYIKHKPFVTSITRSSNGNDQLLEVDEKSVRTEEVFFDYNLSDITHESEIVKVNRILQWMLINPNSYLQVNGYADKNEYLKVNTSEVDSFIIKYPKFNLVSSFTRKNTWKRLDIFRALKICKYLIENGVDSNRINGSAVLLVSDERERMYLNQKVSFTTYLTR